MTENMKKFAEFISAQDKETLENVSKLGKDELIAFAAEKGFTLTEADFEQPEEDEALSLDELDAAAGGKTCACFIAGGGVQDLTEHEDGTESGDGGCACVVGGFGKAFDHDEVIGKDSDLGKYRCKCPGVGYGDSYV